MRRVLNLVLGRPPELLIGFRTAGSGGWDCFCCGTWCFVRGVGGRLLGPPLVPTTHTHQFTLELEMFTQVSIARTWCSSAAYPQHSIVLPGTTHFYGCDCAFRRPCASARLFRNVGESEPLTAALKSAIASTYDPNVYAVHPACMRVCVARPGVKPPVRTPAPPRSPVGGPRTLLRMTGSSGASSSARLWYSTAN